MMLGVGMIMPLLPGRVIAFTGSTAHVGYIASFFAVSYVALQLPMGAMADRLGFKTFIMAGYLFCAFSGVTFYFSRGAYVVFLGRVLQGIGEAPLWALAPALMSLKFPDSKGRVMGIYNAALHIGLTFGPLLGIIAIKLSLGDAAYLFFSAVCAISAAIIYFTVEGAGGSSGAGRADFKNVAALARDKNILATLVGITLYGAGYGIYLTNIPAYLSSVRGYGQTFVQIFFACYYLSISVSQLLTGPFSDRFGREKFMLCGMLVSAAAICAFPGAGREMSLLLLTLGGLGLGTFCLASMAFLNAAAPDSLKGTVSGAYYLFWGIGYLAGPVIAGRLGELPGNSRGFYAYSASLFAMTAIFAALFASEAPDDRQF
jgi:MFS family permease